MEPLAPWLTRDGLPPLPKTYKEPTLWDQMIDLTIYIPGLVIIGAVLGALVWWALA